MGEVAFRGAAPGDVSGRERGIEISPATAAWLAAIPCALITIAVVVLLGPPLSGIVLPQAHLTLLPGDTQAITPEPIEDTRYLLALLGPLLLAAAIVAASRGRPLLSRRWTAAAVVAVQGGLVLLVLACIVAQHQPRWGYFYFSWTTLAVAALLTGALVLAFRSERVRAHVGALLGDTRRRRLLLLAVAAALTAIWLLPAINSETSIRWAFLDHDTEFHFDETFAVLNGLTPLASFSAQYASLFPYLIAVPMRAFEPTLLVFTITACALSLLVLLAIYGVLRRAAGSAALALALFVPFMTTSLFLIGGIPLIRFTPGVYFPMFPLRYGGAYLLAWLVARHIERGRPTAWPLFVAAGFAVLNNFEFGIPALGAAAGALLVTTVPWSRRSLVRFAAAIAAGALSAVALYAIVTLARAGTLPDLWRLAQFAGLYAGSGYSVEPIPGVIGLPLVIFATHVAAIGTATMRACRREPNRVHTGMLMWAGLFGLGSATYYVARSSAGLLPMLFSAWALSLALLAIAVLRRMAANPRRLPDLAGLLVLFGVGVMACSLAQAPAPWAQIERVAHHPAGIALMPARWTPPSDDPAVRRFITSLADGRTRFVVKHGAPIVLFTTMGHREADAYGVVNVLPYTGAESMHTRQQVDDTMDALQAAGGNTALVPVEHVGELRRELIRRGFATVTTTGLRVPPDTDANRLPDGTIVVEGLTKWVDMRHLHPAALG